MFSTEQRRIAPETFIRVDHSYADTIAELCYPNRRTLRNWWYEYRGAGEVPLARHVREPKYPEEMRGKAVEQYLSHSRTDGPNEKWITDVTEFRIPAGKVHLSTVVDCFDGMPLSWSISTSPDAEMANSSLLGACGWLNGGDHPLVHNDRGWPLPMAGSDKDMR